MAEYEPLANKFGPSKRMKEREAQEVTAAPVATTNMTTPPTKQALYEMDETRRQREHDAAVRSRLGWIVGGVWVVAIAVIANFIAAVVVGAAAGAHSIGY
jgi:hypothetical protein